MGMYYADVRSEFVKEKIKETSFKDRKKIDDIIRIEWIARSGYFNGFARKSPKFRELCRKYPKEWEAIWKEINPKDFLKMEEDKKSGKWKEEDRTLRKTKKEAIEALYKEWKKMGGKD